MSNYRSLFTLACKHDYFADGVAAPLGLMPSDDCAVLMAQYGLLFRATPGGGAVYYNNPALLASFDLATPLIFCIVNNDTALLNYTAIDLSAQSAGGSGPTLADSVFYCDNRSDPGGELAPPFTSSAVVKMPPQFAYCFTAPVSTAQLIVQDALQGATEWQLQTPPQPTASADVDLRGLPPGRYSLSVNGAAVLQFYLCGARGSASAGAWGITAIYLGGPAQAAYLGHGCSVLDDQGNITPQSYTMSMTARSTVWRYRIFNNGGDPHKYDNWVVLGSHARNGGSTIEFTRTNPSAPGQPWVFQSQQPLALMQTPGSISFRLQPGNGEGGNRASGSGIKLPYAQGGLLVLPETAAPLNGYSDIYVYL